MNKFFLAFIFIFSPLTFIFSQTKNKPEDVLYLKNEWIIRGKIITYDTSAIKIQTQDGNVFVFKKNEIDTATKEVPWKSFLYKKKGFASYTELGPLVAGKTTIDGVTTAAFSLQTVNGYRFSKYAMIGCGAGADLYATQTIIPLFAGLRGDFSTSGNILPFYFGDAGYGINITQNSSAGQSFRGGLMYEAGFGIKIPFNRNAGFLLSAGYRYQKTAYSFNGTDNEVLYKRIAIGAGFFLQ